MGEGSAAPRHFHPSHLAAYCCGISQEEINGHNNEVQEHSAEAQLFWTEETQTEKKPTVCWTWENKKKKQWAANNLMQHYVSALLFSTLSWKMEQMHGGEKLIQNATS